MEHLTFKKRTTRLGGGELAYNRPNSAIDSHLFSPQQLKFGTIFQSHLKVVKILRSSQMLLKKYHYLKLKINIITILKNFSFDLKQYLK